MYAVVKGLVVQALKRVWGPGRVATIYAQHSSRRVSECAGVATSPSPALLDLEGPAS